MSPAQLIHPPCQPALHRTPPPPPLPPAWCLLPLAGANDTVTLDLRGVSNAFIQPGKPTTLITGTAGGINVVQYTDGTCNVQSNFPFLQARRRGGKGAPPAGCRLNLQWAATVDSAAVEPHAATPSLPCPPTRSVLQPPCAVPVQICQATPFIALPTPNSVWTCGLQVRGTFACTNGK